MVGSSAPTREREQEGTVAGRKVKLTCRPAMSAVEGEGEGRQRLP